MQKWRVNEIYRAVQGEGQYTGWPCTIVRLQGCNLCCPFCDTPQALDSDGGTEHNEISLLSKIKEVHRYGFLLLTGGEPMTQDVTNLILLLKTFGNVHLETNGTLPVQVGFDWVTVSPKGKHTLAGAIDRANEVKWLVHSQSDVIGLTDFLAEWPTFDGVVSVQPVSLDKQATEIAYHAAIDYGWHLSLQAHRLIGVQ